jgi:hypothetical protein
MGEDLAIPALFNWRCVFPQAVSGFEAEALRLVLHYTAANLVQLDRLEQRLEVAFAEALIALALDDLEEDRSNLVFSEDLQQQVFGCAVDQDLALAQLVERFAVIRHAAID